MWLRDGLVLLHSAEAEWPPAITDNYPTMPEGSLGSQGEVTHCYARADRKGLLLFQYFTISQDRQWTDGVDGVETRGRAGRGQRERMGNKFVFSFSFQSTIVCIYQSQVLLVQWTPSAVDTEYRPNEVVSKLNFRRAVLSI